MGRTGSPDTPLTPGVEHPRAMGEEAQELAGWDRADAIVARVQPPEFADRDFLVSDFGATGDGLTDCTAALRAAIEACHAAGGGRVVVPRGVYRTGAIRLRSFVNLHLVAGATLAFDTDPAAYLPVVLTRWQGVELMNYSPFIYAFEAENIAITGAGTLDGRADHDHWWPWVGDEEFGWKPGGPTTTESWARLEEQARLLVPVEERTYGDGSWLRPSFIEPYRCRNVLIEGVTIVRSPMWEIHPVLCHRVLVQDVTIISPGPNNDGCDPESCSDVVIRGCHFDVGDDAIAIKSGRGDDGERVGVPSQDIVIEDCRMIMRYGAFTIGSELTGGVRNVFIRNCHIGSPGLYFGLYIKSNATRGGCVENIHLDNITVTELTKEFVTCDLHRGEGDVGPRTPVVRNIDIRRVHVGSARRALLLSGYERSPIRDVRLTDCSFDHLQEPDEIHHVVGLVVDNVQRGATP